MCGALHEDHPCCAVGSTSTSGIARSSPSAAASAGDGRSTEMEDAPARHVESSGAARRSRFPYEYRAGIVFLLELFMELLDMTVVNVAIPTLQYDLGVDLGGI